MLVQCIRSRGLLRLAQRDFDSRLGWGEDRGIRDDGCVLVVLF